MTAAKLFFIKSTKITFPLAQREIDSVCVCSVQKEDSDFQMSPITQSSLTFSVKICYSHLQFLHSIPSSISNHQKKTEVPTMKSVNFVTWNVFCHVQECFLVKCWNPYHFGTLIQPLQGKKSCLNEWKVFLRHTASPLISSSLCQAVFAWRNLSSRLVAESSMDLTINPHLQSPLAAIFFMLLGDFIDSPFMNRTISSWNWVW